MIKLNATVGQGKRQVLCDAIVTDGFYYSDSVTVLLRVVALVTRLDGLRAI